MIDALPFVSAFYYAPHFLLLNIPFSLSFLYFTCPRCSSRQPYIFQNVPSITCLCSFYSYYLLSINFLLFYKSTHIFYLSHNYFMQTLMITYIFLNGTIYLHLILYPITILAFLCLYFSIRHTTCFLYIFPPSFFSYNTCPRCSSRQIPATPYFIKSFLR